MARLFFPAMIFFIVAVSGFPIYYLWSTVSVITETLPERSLHRERDFAALHYDVLRLSAEIDMYIANSNESNLNSLFTAADLLAIRSGDTKGLYSTDDTAGISKVQEDIDRVVAILDDVRARNVALDADILENISDRLGKDSLLSRRISDQVFQKSMEQVTAQRGQIESFRESMVVLLCVVAALAISLLALLFNQRRTIKALHKQDAELGETMRQMQRADQIKNEFVARMSHDLRTPLNAIIGFSSMIKNGITGPAGAVAYQGYAGNILNASEHLLRLINDILDISRIEANKLELHADQVSVQNLFDYLSRTLSGIIHSKGLHLTISPVSPDVVFEGDEQRLRQAMTNLLSNSIKFTPAGGTISIAFSERPDGGGVMSVSDSGVGIEDAMLSEIVKPFVQLRSSAVVHHEGLGLVVSA